MTSERTPPSPDLSGPLLSVEDLRTYFHTRDGVVRAVDGVSLKIRRGEILGLVGESGSGKSVTARSIMRLVPRPGKIQGGRVIFNGRDLLELSNREMQSVRGAQIGMVLQEPMTSLNPVLDDRRPSFRDVHPASSAPPPGPDGSGRDS